MVASGPGGPPGRRSPVSASHRPGWRSASLCSPPLSIWAVASAYSSDVSHGWGAVLPPAALAACAAAGARYHLTTLAGRLVPSLALIAVFAAVGWGACLAEAYVAAVVVWMGACVMSMERLPLAAALAVVAVMMPGFALIDDSDWGAAVTSATVSLVGYALRLDAEARGAGFRLLAQERAAREAEAVSAALAERARIAREIHDALAHSLSAQLVHLEAAGLQIEREPEGAFRDQILERVVAARGMAREGLAETRQALSALRGEITPVEDFLRELAANDGARTEVFGERRQLGTHSVRPPAARRADRARGRGAHADRRRAGQHRHRSAARHLHGHGEDPHQQPVRQGGAPRPGPGRPVRLSGRACTASWEERHLMG